MNRQRFPEIDLLKCVCILTVVYIHSIATSFDPANFLGYLANDFCRFAVPGLLFAAAFLFEKKTKSTNQIIKKKLIRLLPPYLFCSLCIQFLNLPGLNVGLANLDAGQLIYNIIFGNTLGIYYFVFVLFYLFTASLVLRYIPDKWILGLWGLSAVLLFVFVKVLIVSGMSFFLMLRHPFFHLFAYLSGWVFSLYYQTIEAILKKYRTGIIGCGIVLAGSILVFTRMAGNNFSSFPVLTQLFIYVCVILLLALGIKTSRLQNGIQFFSNYSYGIYLLHLPIVRACQSVYPELSAGYSFVYAFVAWFAGVSISVLIIVIIKKITGSSSRYLVGC